jgi:3-deoxy-manno-octulosonate cytidylyltransferase (CMP-KDO synthetase)
MRAGVFIPARLESTRLPRKLLLADTGQPLIAHTIARANDARRLRPDLIAAIVCAVDHGDLADAVEAAGASAVMTGQHHTSGSSRIAQAAAKPEFNTLDIIINVQGDEPEMDPAAIVKVAELLEDSPDVPMATLVTPIPDESDPRWANPNVVKCVLSRTGDALYFSRAPVPYLRAGGTHPNPRGYHHLGIYAYRRDFLLNFSQLPKSALEDCEKLEQLRVLDAGYRIKAGVVAEAPPGIDTAEDYAAFVNRWKKQNKQQRKR